jgi:hypothetical protein
MLDFSARVAGCKVFSKIDLRKGYYQIPMHPADIRKIAICTPVGLFEFRRMPFRLRNAGNTFQRMMDRILAGLFFVFCYLDDIIISSRDKQEHLEHLREVFSRLREAGLVINAEKCVFATTAVEFLGHKVSAAGVEPLRSHVQAVLTHPEPTNIILDWKSWQPAYCLSSAESPAADFLQVWLKSSRSDPRRCDIPLMQSLSEETAQTALLLWAESLPYCTGCMYRPAMPKFTRQPKLGSRLKFH